MKKSLALILSLALLVSFAVPFTLAAGLDRAQVAGSFTVEEIAVEEPVVEEPAAEEPAEEPADEPAEEPAVDEPVADEPAVDEPTVEEPVIGGPVAEDVVVEELVEETVLPPVEEEVVEEAAEDGATSISAITMGTKPSDGSVSGVPFSYGVAGSNSFRIPALVNCGGALVAAADLRWNTTYDGGGLDTIVARSYNNGSSWSYTVANYLGDNGNVYNGSSSTAFIDPALAVSGGTIYMICDLYPYGVALNGTDKVNPVTTKGFNSDGKLLLSDNNHSSYGYYLDGDTIYSSDGTPVEGYTVDEYFNITATDGSTSNLFFSNSPYKVVRTGFLYLTKSTDGGATWSAPTLLNLKTTSEQVCLVGPGSGLYTSEEKIIFPVYSYNGSSGSQRMGFIYSSDGTDWTRVDSSVNWSSEAAVVELTDGTLRFFYRNGSTNLCYVDYSFSSGWGSAVNTGVDTNSNCQISAIVHSKTVDGERLLLVSCPTGPSEAGSNQSSASYRLNGKIFAFKLAADGSMTKLGSIAVTSNDAQFMYSSMAELSDGRVAILYENSENAWGTGSSCYYTMDFAVYDLEEELGITFDGDDSGDSGETEGSASVTDEASGVTVSTDNTTGTLITELSVTAGAPVSGKNGVSMSCDIEINGGAYTGAATVTIPYDAAFDACSIFWGEADGDVFPVEKTDAVFLCHVPHFSEITVNGATRNVTLEVGQISDDYVITGGNYEDSVSIADESIVEVTVNATTVAGNDTETTVTTITNGNSYYIKNDDGKYLSAGAQWVESIDDAAQWTATSYQGGYRLKNGANYLRYWNSLSITTEQYRAATFTANNGVFSYSNYSTSYTLGSAVTLTPGALVEATEVTFKGLKPGTTTVTVGGVEFKVTVKAKSAEKSLTLKPNGTATLDPAADLGLEGTYDISYQEYDSGEVITLSGNTVTAAETTGGATLIATVKDSSGIEYGTVTYTIHVTDRGGAQGNIEVAVGGDETISLPEGDLQEGESVIWTVSDSSIASVAGVYDNTANAYTDDAVVIGNSVPADGKTATVTGTIVDADGNELAVYTWEVTVTESENASQGTGTRKIYISVAAIENCTVYYSINGGALIPVNGTGVLIDKTISEPELFNIMFFAAPNDGYALVSMNATDTDDQYYTLSNGNPDGTGSDAWPFVDANATKIPSSGSDSAWKSGHGFRWALIQGNMSIAQMKVLFSNAYALGCDGATTITVNNTDNGDTKTSAFSFIAEKLPTLEKSILYVNGEAYDGTKPLEFDDVITYQFTVTSYSTDVNYTGITLKDEDIEHSQTIANNTFDTAGTYNYTATYTLTAADIDKYTGGEFHNTAALKYTYKSDYSSGSYGGTAEGSVSCQINGIVSYQWEEEVQGVTGITDQGLPAGSTIKYGDPYTILNRPGSESGYEDVQVTDAYGNVIGTWTFDGWTYNGNTYQPGGVIKMPTEGSVVFTGEWTYTAIGLESYTITYQWTNAPDGETLPTDTNRYVTNQPYTVDTKYTNGYKVNDVQDDITVGYWTFSGWNDPNNKVMGNSNVTITGEWTYTALVGDLTVKKTVTSAVTEQQSFLFNVKNEAGTVDMDVVVTLTANQLDGSVTIENLPVGNYTVTEDTNWSWRYEVASDSNATQTVTLTAEGGTVVFNNQLTNNYWLDGSDAVVNTYSSTAAANES